MNLPVLIVLLFALSLYQPGIALGQGETDRAESQSTSETKRFVLFYPEHIYRCDNWGMWSYSLHQTGRHKMRKDNRSLAPGGSWPSLRVSSLDNWDAPQG